jgi:uncharacterized protein involved in exopolysaccharide biosynthesis
MAYEISLPQDDSGTFADYLDALRRRRGTAIKIALTILVLGALAIFLWPNTYRSTATILIEDPEVPPGLVPTTVTTFAARQVQYINQRVMTRTNMAQIIEKFDLFPAERKHLPTLLLVEDVQQNVKIDVVDAQISEPGSGREVKSMIAFSVGFEHSDPNTARQVANELVSLYLAENVKARTEQTAETSQFMQVEVDRMDAEVREIESEIAKIKQENEGRLPEQAAMNLGFIQRTEGEISDIDQRLDAQKETRIILQAQIAQLDPMDTMVLPDGTAVMGPADQLRSKQTLLAMLQGRYSDDHPDVLRVKREIAALQEQVGVVELGDTTAALSDARSELAKAREKYTVDHPEVKRLERQVAALEAEADSASAVGERPLVGRDGGEPDNPAYLAVQAELSKLDAEEASLLAKRRELQGKLDNYEQNLLQSSDVERQLSALLRKLSTANETYRGARERLFMARMGQSLETQSKGERFTLVEPPDLPLKPASPNRPVLLALVMLLTLAGALGWPQVAESMDSSINSGRAVERVQGFPPIAEIPLIETAKDRTHRRTVQVTSLVAVPVGLLIIAVLVHFLFMPLDVLWYVAMQKLGM